MVKFGIIHILNKMKLHGKDVARVFLIVFIVFNSFSTFSQVLQSTDSLKVDSISQLNKILIKDTVPTKPNAAISADSSTLPKKRVVIPGRATLFSTFLPGLGQVYNGKYWKVPIIYSVFLGVFFNASENNFKYKLYKEQYRRAIDPLLEIDPNYVGYTEATLLQRKDYYKRNRDFMIILGGLAYLLNILDANVDAHLMDYDINQDLSLKMQPEVNNYFAGQNNSYKSTFGIKFVLSMH